MQIDGGNGEVSLLEYTMVDSRKMQIVKRNSINPDEVKREFGELLEYLREYVERDQCVMWKNGLGYLTLRNEMSVEEVRNLIDVDYKVFEFRNVPNKRYFVITFVIVINTYFNIKSVLTVGINFPKDSKNAKTIIDEVKTMVKTPFLTKLMGKNKGWAIIGIQESRKWDEMMAMKSIKLPSGVSITFFPPSELFQVEDNALIATNPPLGWTCYDMKRKLVKRGVEVVQVLKFRRQENDNKSKKKDELDKAFLIYLTTKEEYFKLIDMNHWMMSEKIQYFVRSVDDAVANGNHQVLYEIYVTNYRRNSIIANNSHKAANIKAQFDMKDISSAARIMEVSKEEIIANTNHQINYVDMKLVERIQFATQQVEKNVVWDVQRMIKQACNQLKEEILSEMIIGFNKLEGIIENLSMFYLYLNLNINNFIKNTWMTTETMVRTPKATRILRKQIEMKEARLMKIMKVKANSQIDLRREIGLMKVGKKKRRKLKCNEKK